MDADRAATILKRRQRFLRLSKAVTVLAVLNTFLLMVGGLIVGGVPDQVVDGHYYVASRRELFEVSREAYLYARFHLIGSLVLFGIAFVLGFVAAAVSQLPPPLTSNETGT